MKHSQTHHQFPFFQKNRLYSVSYYETGPGNGVPVIAIPGLTQNAHEFDWIADDLADHGYRVLALDLPGRGHSEWLDDPSGYEYDTYYRAINAMMLDAGVADQPVIWLGISLGGILGMYWCSQPNNNVAALILDDIGPESDEATLKIMADFLFREIAFDSFEEGRNFSKAAREPNFGKMTEDQWDKIARHALREGADGKWRPHFDRAIGQKFAAEPMGPPDLDLWAAWKNVTCPALILRGAHSTLFTIETAQKMLEDRKIQTDFIEFEGCGHVPPLNNEPQIKAVRDWILSIHSPA